MILMPSMVGWYSDRSKHTMQVLLSGDLACHFREARDVAARCDGSRVRGPCQGRARGLGCTAVSTPVCSSVVVCNLLTPQVQTPRRGGGG